MCHLEDLQWIDIFVFQWPYANLIDYWFLEAENQSMQGWFTWIVLFFITHLMPLVLLCTPWKHEKTKNFLIFSGGIKKASSMKWVSSTLIHMKEKMITNFNILELIWLVFSWQLIQFFFVWIKLKSSNQKHRLKWEPREKSC